MPALVAFGRKWEIGSDDLVYPVLFDLLIRLIWLVVTIVFYWKNGTDMECPGRENVQIFIYGVLGILHLMILANLALAYNSMKGGIMDTYARRFVPLCLYIRLTLQLTELGWNVLGTVWEFKGIFDCEDAPDTITVIQGLIISNWIVILFVLIFWWCQFDAYGNSKPSIGFEAYDAADGSYKLSVTRRSSAWERRWRFLCCLSGKEASSKQMKEAFKEGGKALSFLLNGRNLVCSDVLAGFVILGLKHREIKKRKEMNRTVPFSHRTSINFNEKSGSMILPATEDWNSIENIAYYHHYALAIHTLPASFCFKKDFLSTLCRNMQCCSCLPGRKNYPVEVDADTCCYSKSAALRSFVEDQNIVYISLNNTNFLCPFFVAVDHTKKKILIVTRGTFSCVDFVIDGMTSPTVFNMPGVPSHFRAHEGMLTAAKSIHNLLKELEILEKLKTSYPDYELLLTGISLGAGLCTLLSIMLKTDYPELKCIAVSPPGAILSKEAAEYCNDFLISLVYGEDMVPRFTLKSFYRALNQVESVLAECKTPKYQINMGIGLWALGLKQMNVDYRSDNGPSDFASDTRTENRTAIGNSESGSEVVLQQNELLSTREKLDFEVRQAMVDFLPEMYCPGRILHVTETPLHRKGKGQMSHPDGPRWEIRWADRSEFNELIISKRILLDHIPFRLMRAFSYFSQVQNKDSNTGDKNEPEAITVQP